MLRANSMDMQCLDYSRNCLGLQLWCSVHAGPIGALLSKKVYAISPLKLAQAFNSCPVQAQNLFCFHLSKQACLGVQSRASAQCMTRKTTCQQGIK